jgi:hypothetical protein
LKPLNFKEHSVSKISLAKLFVAIAVGCAYIKPMKTIFFSVLLSQHEPS